MSGCGGSSDAPTVYPVTGKVTKGGAALPDVQVNFIAMDETGLPSSGVTDAEGMYTLHRHTGDEGAMPGNYRVVLSDTKAVPGPQAYSNPQGGAPQLESRIPEKWQSKEKSPKTVEVKAEPNVIDIDVEGSE
jgi:hypothetical protein